MARRAHIFSWILGVAALVAVVAYFQPQDFLDSVRKVGLAGAVGWLAATLLSRLWFTEVPRSLLQVLGYRVGRLQLFAIGWLRTFSNQVVPMTGVAVYLQQIRQKSGASWQELAATSSQQAFIGIAALGAVGFVAVILNAQAVGDAAIPLAIAFGVLGAGFFAVASGAAWAIKLLPERLRLRLVESAESLQKLAASKQRLAGLVAVHASAVLLRGTRIWLLFAVSSVTLGWQEALLIVALAEATVLVAITPGGLGIREAIIIGGAALLNLPTDVAVAVSLIDRLFVVVLTGAMAGPSAYLLMRNSSAMKAPD